MPGNRHLIISILGEKKQQLGNLLKSSTLFFFSRLKSQQKILTRGTCWWSDAYPIVNLDFRRKNNKKGNMLVVCCSSSFSWIWSSIIITIIFVFNINHNHHHHHQEQDEGEPVDGLLQLLLLVLDPPLHQLEVSLTVTLKIVESIYIIFISTNILSCCDNYLSITLRTQIFQTENSYGRLSWNHTITCSNPTFSLFTTSKRSFAFPSIWS